MPITINGNGTVTGLAVGGLPDGIVDADTLAANAVTSGKLASGVGGKVLQVLQDTKTDDYGVTSSGTTTYTIPGLEQAITLSNANNKVLVVVNLNVNNYTGSKYYNQYNWNIKSCYS